MTYAAARKSHSELIADVLRQTGRNTSFTPDRITWVTVGTQATSATLTTNSTVINLPAGSSYYLEGSLGALAGSRSSTAELQFYNISTGTYIGQSARLCINNSHGFETVQGRRVARALILDSEITTSMDVALVLKGGTNTGNLTFTCNATGINAQPIGIPTLRIIELPS